MRSWKHNILAIINRFVTYYLLHNYRLATGCCTDFWMVKRNGSNIGYSTAFESVTHDRCDRGDRVAPKVRPQI